MVETTPSTLAREVSPPALRKKDHRQASSSIDETKDDVKACKNGPSLAAIEAGQAKIRDHLAYFSEHLRKASRPVVPSIPRLSIEDFQALYQRNQHPHGHHFVVHQHNHPIAGVHYDLRLQFSQSSTISFAVPYGLPGNPNSRRQGRMAIETRVHNLWNNLIESASHATGSLLIWDTGEFEVLTRESKAAETDDELTNVSDVDSNDRWLDQPTKAENEKLIVAFQAHHIRLRLHGTRLPPNYTISLRLSSHDHAPKPPTRKRRRKDLSMTPTRPAYPATDSDTDNPHQHSRRRTPSSRNSPAIKKEAAPGPADVALANASEDEGNPGAEDAAIRASNAYTGATNDIGSAHQRHWFLRLDRRNCGFVRLKSGRWVRPDLNSTTDEAGAAEGGGEEGRRGGFEPFFVRGAEVERSVVTGRLSSEVMADEGVEGFVGRKMWRAVLE